jgi:hypothetical protein
MSNFETHSLSDQQKDEIEALSSIFGDEFVTISPGSYRVQIERSKDPSGHGDSRMIQLDITFGKNCSDNSHPDYTLSAPWMKRKDKSLLMSDLQSVCQENEGEPVVYLWIEKCGQFLDDLCRREQSQDQNKNQVVNDDGDQLEKNNRDPQPHLNIIHGEAVVDRKSVFQAHACIVSTVEEVKYVIRHLKENKKIADATHNIVAYRLSGDKNNIIQDCEDDGESHAGGRLLHLLSVTDVRNVVVVVSRWFGGIQLGPDRFKHINNVARSILTQMNLITNSVK